MKIFGAVSASCPVNVCGTVMENNDFFNDSAMRTNCNGTLTPTGPCTAAEPIWESKGGGGPDPDDWVLVLNNRIWGFWGPSDSDICCLTGSSGGLVNITNTASGDVVESFYMLFDSNIFGESEDVTVVGQPRVTARNITHINNLFVNNDSGTNPTLEIDNQCDDCEAYFNIFVNNDVSIEINSNSDAMGNVFVNNNNFTGSSSGTEDNAYYNSADGGDSNKIDLPNASQANNDQFCYWRKLQWNPEQICINNVLSTNTSPHWEWQVISPRSGKGVNNATPGTYPLNKDFFGNSRGTDGTAGPFVEEQVIPPTPVLGNDKRGFNRGFNIGFNRGRTDNE